MLRLDALLPAGARLVLQIHDELVVEAEERVAEQAARASHEAMTGAWKLEVPLVGPGAQRTRTWLEVS